MEKIMILLFCIIKVVFLRIKCFLNGYNEFYLYLVLYIYVIVVDKKEYGGIVFCEEGLFGGFF